MSRWHDKTKLLQILSETPIVTLACKKVGLNPCTYYRWYKSDRSFRAQADEILSIGRMHVSDMAEGSIIKEIKNGNMRANIFWLQHNNPRYKPVRTTYVDPINPHAHELKPGETCRSCGYMEPVVEEYKKKKHKQMTNEQLSKETLKLPENNMAPFESEAQRRYLYAFEPNIAKRFEEHSG